MIAVLIIAGIILCCIFASISERLREIEAHLRVLEHLLGRKQ